MRARFMLLVVFAAVAILALALVPAGYGHVAGPCNDSDGDGSPSGREYAEHHISAMAKEGMLGDGGHKPGSHRGFSACDPSGR